MRVTALISLAVVAIGVNAGAAEECGSLGVMNVDPATLPEGVDPAAVRQCKEHPLGRSNITEPIATLDKRECYTGTKTYGCTDNMCWKICNTLGSGQWCWQAWNGGYGAWRTCGGDGDCALTATADCGQGGCDKCGCSC